MDPTLKFKIIRQLKDNFENFSPKLKLVAKYITDNPADFGLDPIRTTSQKINISTFTLFSMAEVLGFDSYEALRDPFRKALVTTSEANADLPWLNEMAAKGETGQDQANAARNTLTNVQRSLHLIDPVKMERVVDTLFAAQTVYVTATRATYALAYFFNYIGSMSLPSLRLIPGLMGSTIDELSTAEPDDVLIAITFAPYSKETIEACRFANKKGMKLIFITDNNLIVPGLEPTEVLVASTLSTHHFAAYTGGMAVLENLIALMMKKGGQNAMESIKNYEDLRDEYSAYWTDNKKH